MTQCEATDVESRSDLSGTSGIVKHGNLPADYKPRVLHSGLLTHRCELETHPSTILCRCACGHKWLRNF